MCSYLEKIQPNQIKKVNNIVKDNYNGIPFPEDHLSLFSWKGLYSIKDRPRISISSASSS